jgi:hypothetical protein
LTPADADELPSIIGQAQPNTTFLLADGLYQMSIPADGPRTILINAAGVTVRSASGNAEAVIIDGEYMTKEIFALRADGITLAEISVTRALHHLVHVSPGGNKHVEGTLLYGLRLIDGGEQFVKVNSNGAQFWSDAGRVQCSRFLLTDTGRPHIANHTGGCYTGGIDTHGGRDWVVRNNHFEGIYCTNGGLAEHAIHFWRRSRDTLIENNTIIDCARGIGLGLIADGPDHQRTYDDEPYPEINGYIDHLGGVVRNNFIWNAIDWYDTGIGIVNTRGAVVVHNTVVSDVDHTNSFFSSLDYRFPLTQVEIQNNLVRRITRRADAEGNLLANHEDPPVEFFVDAPAADLHLTAAATAAIDAGIPHPQAGHDIDGQQHSETNPDIGADEYP